MKRIWFLLLLFLVACGGDKQAGVFRPDARPTATARVYPNEAIAISLAELGANPPAYEGLLLRLSGAYSKTALQTCFPKKGVQPKWGMVGDALLLNAIGYESVLGLMPANTNMTIEGVWRQYTGPLGCGKEPPTGTVWYLETLSIVAPNPLPNYGVASNNTNNGEQNNNANTAPIVTTAVPLPTTPDTTTNTTPESIPTPLPVGTSVTATPTSVIIAPLPTATRPATTATPTTTPTATATSTPSNNATATSTPSNSATATSTVTPSPAPTKDGAEATTTPLPTETPPPSRTPVVTSTPIPPQATFTPGPYGGGGSTPYP